MANQGNWALTNSLPAHNPKPKASSIHPKQHQNHQTTIVPGLTSASVNHGS
jgi:hypothetical protein